MPPSELPDPPLRAIIVDDERPVRASLRFALEAADGVEIVAECSSGLEAIDAIRREEPDVVFLDIMMPEVDGFEVVATIGPDRMPPVVFVTAHDMGAVQAFESAAVDYVLKPFDEDRIIRALQRVPAKADRSDLTSRLRQLLDHQNESAGKATRILVRSDRGYTFVPVDSVYWFEADGKFVKLHSRNGTHRVRATLRDVLESLDSTRFIRVHRSSVLDRDHIREIEPWFGGDHLAILITGEKVRVSRTYAPNLLRLLS